MIDIVIVNCNSTDHLLNCLRSVEDALNGMRARMYLQDNASTDGIEKVPDIFPDVVLTRNKRNIGFAAAVNQVLAVGENPYIVLLNPDTVLSDRFFEKSLDFMKKTPRAGIIGPKILERGGELQNSARSFPTIFTAFFGRTSLLSRLFPKNPVTRKNLVSIGSDGSAPMEVDWVSGACMVVRRKAYLDVGGLDERFFLYWEDADWCRRMWEAGWKVVYYPKACVRHFTGASSEKNFARSVFEFHKSAFRLYEKYRGSGFSVLKYFVLAGLFARFCMVTASGFANRIRANTRKNPNR